MYISSEARSSSGLGRLPFKQQSGVRLSVGLINMSFFEVIRYGEDQHNTESLSRDHRRLHHSSGDSHRADDEIMSYRRKVGPASNTYAFDPPGKNEIRIWLTPVWWRNASNGGFYITKKWGTGIPTTYTLSHVWFGDNDYVYMLDGCTDINSFTFTSLKNQAIKNYQECKDQWTPQDEPDLKLLGLM